MCTLVTQTATDTILKAGGEAPPPWCTARIVPKGEQEGQLLFENADGLHVSIRLGQQDELVIHHGDGKGSQERLTEFVNIVDSPYEAATIEKGDAGGYIPSEACMLLVSMLLGKLGVAELVRPATLSAPKQRVRQGSGRSAMRQPHHESQQRPVASTAARAPPRD